jgi:hypothetical protein
MDDKNDTIAMKFKGLTPSEFLDKMEMRALRVLNLKKLKAASASQTGKSRIVLCVCVCGPAPESYTRDVMQSCIIVCDMWTDTPLPYLGQQRCVCLCDELQRFC